MTKQYLQSKVELQDLISPEDQEKALDYLSYVKECVHDLFGRDLPSSLHESICDFYYQHQSDFI